MILPFFKTGQYITVAENPSKDKHFAPRHYTISCRPADATDRLRITVKKLRAPSADVEDGIMSSFVNGLKAGNVVRPRMIAHHSCHAPRSLYPFVKFHAESETWKHGALAAAGPTQSLTLDAAAAAGLAPPALRRGHRPVHGAAGRRGGGGGLPDGGHRHHDRRAALVAGDRDGPPQGPSRPLSSSPSSCCDRFNDDARLCDSSS
jgi:hypothetical protein